MSEGYAFLPDGYQCFDITYVDNDGELTEGVSIRFWDEDGMDEYAFPDNLAKQLVASLQEVLAVP